MYTTIPKNLARWDLAFIKQNQQENTTYISTIDAVYTMKNKHLVEIDRKEHINDSLKKINENIKTSWEPAKHYQTKHPNHTDHSLHFVITTSSTLKPRLYIWETKNDNQIHYRTKVQLHQLQFTANDTTNMKIMIKLAQDSYDLLIPNKQQNEQQQTQLQNLKSYIQNFRRKNEMISEPNAPG
jgi:hypothetical protein